MVELRKRKAPAQPPVTEKKSKPAAGAKDVVDTAVQSMPQKAPQVGDIINLDDFGGEFKTNDGVTTTLKRLVAESVSGVVLFTYPRASTPGCTKQACLFRDGHTHLTSSGLSIYGLSTDSPKANTTFRTKQNLPYPLLCDTGAALIGSIGFKKAPKGTTRGVFAIDKEGRVLLREAGGPDATVDAVHRLVANESEKKDSQAVNNNSDSK